MTTFVERKRDRKERFWIIIFSFLYLALLVALTVMNRLGSDSCWLGAINLYLPQVVWALPGVIIVLASIIVARRWIWVPLLGIAWVVGPIMGFCWSFQSGQKPAKGQSLRIMTWNVKYGTHNNMAIYEIINEIKWNKPDIVLLQDARGLMDGPLGIFLNKWNISLYGQYIIASKLPLGEPQVRMISFAGENHTCVRTRFLFGNTPVTLYNVHFQTPRWGLNALRATTKRPWYLPKAIEMLENNIEDRLAQVQALRNYICLEWGPVIVAGDLNSPDSSKVCSILRSVGMHDAFAEGGKGYGYTYGHFLLQHKLPAVNISWMRIDHIMMSPHFKTLNCWTGTDKASAHRPVIADLVLRYK